MSNDNTQDTNEPSPASAGSHGEPVMWAIQWDGDDTPDAEFCYRDRLVLEDVLAQAGIRGSVVPLYRHHTLTDDEKEAIDNGACALETNGDNWDAETLLALLERTK